MRCTNPDCLQDINEGARFCPFCRAEQAVAAPSGASGPTVRNRTAFYEQADPDPGSSFVLGFAVVSASPAGAKAEVRHDDVLVMRAGEQIWHDEEAESNVVPGERRPLLILDEQVTHLAHTHRRLEPDRLLERVQNILESQQVPVDVRQVPTCWLRDKSEVRSRLVASLKNHRYSDIKLLLGVDYVGTWASIQMHLGLEPEPLPIPPSTQEAPDLQPPVQEHPFAPPVHALVLGALGVLAFVAGFTGKSVGWSMVGIVAVVAGVVWYNAVYGEWDQANIQRRREWEQARQRLRQDWEAEQQRLRQAWEEAERRQASQKAQQRLSRTFKVDDMRLFCSAMRAVFQAVVDDIVEQGGEVTRIDGGSGGFFQTAGVTHAVAAERRSDAAEIGV